jgi:predicted nucleotidyltransferase
MFGLIPEDIEKIKSVFRKHFEIESVIIYGSRAKGNYKIGSDIDLTIKGTEVNFDLLQIIENEIDNLLLPYKTDLSVFKDIKNKELIDHINRVGKEFYNKERYD